jgi:hypothetical protein
MASAQSGEEHLRRTSIPAAVSIMENIQSWLSAAKFVPAQIGDFAKCAESEDDQRVQLDALFKALGISYEVFA